MRMIANTIAHFRALLSTGSLVIGNIRPRNSGNEITIGPHFAAYFRHTFHKTQITDR